MFRKQLKIVNHYRNECKDIRLIFSETYLDHKSKYRRSNIDDNTSYISTTSPSTDSKSVTSTNYGSSDTSPSTDPPEKLIAKKSDAIMATVATLTLSQL